MQSSRVGLFESSRRLASTALELANVRLELLVTDLELEKRRLVDVLMLVLLGAVLLGLGLILFVGFVLMLVWEPYRLGALTVLMLGFVAGGGWLLVSARRKLRGGPPLFGATSAELKRDRAAVGAGEPDEHTQF